MEAGHRLDQSKERGMWWALVNAVISLQVL
jgi:hypothetical protein